MGEQLPVRVLVVDDHAAVVDRVRKLLSSEFAVVATAAGGLEMLDACERYDPDVIVSDVSMPGLSGIEATRKILESRPNTRIIMLSIHREEEVVQSALDAGALAYVHKLSAGEDLIPAIYSALAGRRFISASCNYRPV